MVTITFWERDGLWHGRAEEDGSARLTAHNYPTLEGAMGMLRQAIGDQAEVRFVWKRGTEEPERGLTGLLPFIQRQKGPVEFAVLRDRFADATGEDVRRALVRLMIAGEVTITARGFAAR